jgi:hypothetical protein
MTNLSVWFSGLSRSQVVGKIWVLRPCNGLCNPHWKFALCLDHVRPLAILTEFPCLCQTLLPSTIKALWFHPGSTSGRIQFTTAANPHDVALDRLVLTQSLSMESQQTPDVTLKLGDHT